MQCKCTWKGIGKRAGIILAVSAVSVSAIYFGGMRIRQAVTTMTAPKKETPVIVLDAGHGGADGGCVSVNDVPEKGINLNILLSLRDFLRMEGYTVEVTRDTDRSIHDDGVEGIANQKSSDMDNRLALLTSTTTPCASPCTRTSSPMLPIPEPRCFTPTMSRAAVLWHRLSRMLL